MTHRLLCLVAHPDDETFGTGGTLIRAAESGAEVYIACATRGEAGEIADRSDATPETLPQVREAEYHAAGKAMGVTRSQFLGYRDSGMAGTEENSDPRAFTNQPKEKIIAQILELFDEIKPEVVISFEPGGGYGHPDHMFISECATEAVKRRNESSEDEWSPMKLYYFVFPRSKMRAWIEEFRKSDPDSDFANIDPDMLGVPDEEISLTLDTRPYADKWRAAIAEHQSQYSPLDRMPQHIQDEFVGSAYLIRALPEWDGTEPETDLFDGI